MRSKVTCYQSGLGINDRSSRKKGIKGPLSIIRVFPYLSNTKYQLMIKISNVLAVPLYEQDLEGALDLVGENDILVHTTEITPTDYPDDTAIFRTKVFCMLYTEVGGIAVNTEQPPWVMWHHLLPMGNFIISYPPAERKPRLWLISFQHEQPSFLRFACVQIDDPTGSGRRGGKSIGAASVGK